MGNRRTRSTRSYAEAPWPGRAGGQWPGWSRPHSSRSDPGWPALAVRRARAARISQLSAGPVGRAASLRADPDQPTGGDLVRTLAPPPAEAVAEGLLGEPEDRARYASSATSIGRTASPLRPAPSQPPTTRAPASRRRRARPGRAGQRELLQRRGRGRRSGAVDGREPASRSMIGTASPPRSTTRQAQLGGRHAQTRAADRRAASHQRRAASSGSSARSGSPRRRRTRWSTGRRSRGRGCRARNWSRASSAR